MTLICETLGLKFLCRAEKSHKQSWWRGVVTITILDEESKSCTNWLWMPDVICLCGFYTILIKS